MRPLRLTTDSSYLYASTMKGTIQKYSFGLELIASSAPSTGMGPLFALLVDGDFIYARDIAGKLGRWRRDTLFQDRIIDLNSWADPDHADVPNVSHCLFVFGRHVYVAMPFGPLGKFNRETFAFEGLSEYRGRALIEGAATSGPGHHFAVDFAGFLYRGRVDGSMREVARVSHGACHEVHYDRLHDRFWFTDDYHCGLGLFRAADPNAILRLDLSNDDVEGMAFGIGCSEVLVPCFDRFVYHLANEAVPRVIKRIGPFPYQVTGVTWPSGNSAYAVTESGELVKIDVASGALTYAGTGTNAVWDIRACPEIPSEFWVAFESGHLRRVRVDGANFRCLSEIDLGRGLIRRVIGLDDGGALVLTATGHVVRLDSTSDTVWEHLAKPLLRDFDVHEGTVVFCAETGELTALDTRDGTVRWSRNLGVPLWAVGIEPGGRGFVAAARLRELGDQGKPSTRRSADVFTGSVADGSIWVTTTCAGNIKKFRFLDQNRLLYNGNGEAATSVVSWPNFEPLEKWSEWQLNTCEAALVLGDHVFTTTYGFQLNTYAASGETLESAFPFEDYATSLAKVTETTFLAGGRGAFVTLFGLKGGLPTALRTLRFP